MGGATYLKALLPQIELVPTGGVTLLTSGDFLKVGAFALGIGGDLVERNAIAARMPSQLTKKNEPYVATVETYRGRVPRTA